MGNLEPPSGSSGCIITDRKIDPVAGMAVDVTTEAGAPNVSPPTCVTPATETPTP